MAETMTPQQWADLNKLFRDCEPKTPTSRELASCLPVTAVTMAGSDSGMLFHFEIGAADGHFVYVNAIPALVLARDIAAAGDERGWWNEGLAYQRNSNLRIPASADADSAAFIASLAVVAAPHGVFVKTVTERRAKVYAMTKNIAMEIMLGIRENTLRFEWIQQIPTMKGGGG
jgi:hypothetical protein